MPSDSAVTLPEPPRRWTEGYLGDVRELTPPPGACTERRYSEGDPSTPCTLYADGHRYHEDPEGYYWAD